jgi:hypothetical protein
MLSPDVPVGLVASRDDEGVVPETALQVRKAIYSHDQLTVSDMDLVLGIARKAGRQPCPEWTAVFCDALTDYVVHQNDPADYIPQEKADWLTATLAKNGGVCSRTEFEMLIDVMTHALGVPTSLSTFALSEIKTAIIKGRRDAITGEDHPAGIVTKADVEALRAVLYAAKTGTPGHVTRDEAEVLFEIAHATSQADPSFDELFARAIANYLMAINLHVPDAAEALHFEKWLDEKEDLAGFWSRMFHGLPTGNSFNVFESPAKAYEADMARQDADDRTLLHERENITDSEAAWVIAHLTHEGELSSAEKRLLQFLEAQALSIAPPLRALIDKENLAAVSSGRS